MKPFRFTLEAVATIRQRREREMLETYAQSLLVRRRAWDRLAAIQHDLEAAWSRTRQELAKGCSASMMSQLREYNRLLEEERNRCETALRQAERAVNQALQRMLAARQQREAVDRFRCQQRARYDRELNRETQKFLDELSTQRALPARAWKSTADP